MTVPSKIELEIFKFFYEPYPSLPTSSPNIMNSISNSIEELITTYQEVNPSQIDELEEEPSPLQFMRYVARNRPFVIRKGASEWYACQKWNAKLLREEVGDAMVQVAITPFG